MQKLIISLICGTILFTGCTKDKTVTQENSLLPTPQSTPSAIQSSAPVQSSTPTSSAKKTTPSPKATTTTKPTTQNTTTTNNSSNSNTGNSNTTSNSTNSTAPTATQTNASTGSYNFRLTIPNGGDDWKQGQQVQLGWSFGTVNQNISSYPLYVTIELIKPDNSVAYTISSTAPTSEGSAERYPWQIPNSIPSGTYKIRMKINHAMKTSSGTQYPQDESDQTFTISSGTTLSFSNLSDELKMDVAKFSFSFNGTNEMINIYASTNADMSNKVSLIQTSAQYSPPHGVATPGNMLSGYNCGATIYWHAVANVNVVTSETKSGTVSC